MIWKFITFLVRILDPEKAHNITLLALKYGLHPRLQKIKIKIINTHCIYLKFLNHQYHSINYYFIIPMKDA